MTFFWIFITLVILVMLLDRGIDKMYGYESPSHHKTPQTFEIPFDEIGIPAKDGGQLYGWWIPVAPVAPTLILIHGWSRNVERMLPYIRKLHPLGYNLLVFDARNHGSSSPTPRPTVGTFTEDILAAVDYLVSGEKVTSPEIGLVGLSIGGGASIAAAGRDKRIQAAVTVGALSHPIKVMRAQFEERHVPQFVGSFLFGFMRLRYGLDFNKIAPVNLMPNANAKILLIHGANDKTIALDQAQDLLAANTGKAQLWIVPEKGHSDCHLHPDFWEKVGTFLNETLPV
ncbi:MAG: alpha/beta hydrolase [Anaerolineales bacterium]|nr:alpha/beta hydrolase [Anaerolineales bacterium]